MAWLGDSTFPNGTAWSRDGHGRWRAARPLLGLVAACGLLTGCWFQPGWGPHRSGHNPNEHALTIDNVAGLAEAWSVSLGTVPVRDPVVTTQGVHATSGRSVSTVRMSDGATRWSAAVLGDDVPDGLFQVGAPSVRGSEVLVPAYVDRRLGLPGAGVHAFDATTGAGGDMVATAGSGDSVTVAGDTLVVTRAEVLGTDFIVGIVEVAVLGDPDAGWLTVVGIDEFPSAAVLGDDQLLFVASGSIDSYALTAPTDCPTDPIWCEPVWSRSVARSGTPVLSDDGRTVYVVGSALGQVWALDSADGSIRWTTEVGAPLNGSLTLGDGRLYATSNDGRIYAIDVDACEQGPCTPVWGATTGSPISKQATLAGGVLYVGSDDGTIQAWDAAGCGSVICLPVWQASTGSRITGGPVVAVGHLVIGTEDGRLNAYRLA